MGPFSLSSFSSLLPSTARGAPLAGSSPLHSGATLSGVAATGAASLEPHGGQGGGTVAQKEAAQGTVAASKEPSVLGGSGAREGGGHGDGPTASGSSTPSHGALLVRRSDLRKLFLQIRTACFDGTCKQRFYVLLSGNVESLRA